MLPIFDSMSQPQLVAQHLQGEAPPSYEEMVCDSCMVSCDFLRLYQLRTTPTRVAKENQSHSASSGNTSSVDITSESETGNGKDEAAGSHSKAAPTEAPKDTLCELARRKEVLMQNPLDKKGAGYFDKTWRAQLCKCEKCKVQ